MQLDTIIQTLLSAAAFLKKPVQHAAADSIKPLFEATCDYLRRKLGPDSDGAKMLGLALEKPASAMRKAVVVEEAHAAGLSVDEELRSLAEQLSALLPPDAESSGHRVQVSGQSNRVMVAGRDMIHTARVVHRTAATPDERHVTIEEKKQIRALVGELATRLAGKEGAPNFAAAHRMLQRKMGVESYRLIPREQFANAVRFLKHRCAMFRLRSVRPAEEMTQGAQ
jgi:hypothetical protein